MATTDPNSFDSSYAGAGASLGGTIGSAVPIVGTAAGTIIGGTAGLAMGGIKYLLSSAQRKQANSIHPYDPGYEMNKEVLDNARIAGENYGNYQMPGYQQAADSIQNNTAAGMARAERGATSSADVIDAANKGAGQQGQQLEQLAATSAQGKESALTRYLAAKAQAGEEAVNKNTYDREMYNQQLQLKNQLNNNATANQYGAADQAGKLLSAIFSMKKAAPTNNNYNLNPVGSVFDASKPYNDNSNVNGNIMDASAGIGNPNNYNA